MFLLRQKHTGGINNNNHNNQSNILYTILNFFRLCLKNKKYIFIFKFYQIISLYYPSSSNKKVGLFNYSFLIFPVCLNKNNIQKTLKNNSCNEVRLWERPEYRLPSTLFICIISFKDKIKNPMPNKILLLIKPDARYIVRRYSCTKNLTSYLFLSEQANFRKKYIHFIILQ